MEQPKIPTNEADRIQALYSYNILDTVPEQSYDDIIAIASSICDTPISLISLVDKDRCWFKAKLGLENQETPREIAYAAHAINVPDEPTIIEDALTDARFFDCPLVLADPPMRFYVGTPLVTKKGHVLGTLCVIDHQPKKLKDTQISTLKILAKQVVTQFELRKKINEVNQLNQKLQIAYDEMEAFSYSVSHDLKAPLRGIKGFSELILEEYRSNLDEDGQELFKEIIYSVDKMDGLIMDIIDLAKINQQDLVPTEINLSELCQEIIQEHPDRADYQIEIAPNLFVLGDAKLMKIVWRNLIGNAFKYSSKVDKPIIRIGQEILSGTTVSYIKDNGAGFDMETAAKIFHPFHRLHGESEFEGNGIGLAIVKRIINRHEGKVWAESKINFGASFYFTMKDTGKIKR